MSRRTFLARAARASAVPVAATLGGTLAASLGACTRSCSSSAPPIAPVQGLGRLEAGALATLAAATEAFLPSSPGAPGAREVRAAAYIDATLEGDHLQPAHQAHVRGGLARLEQLAREEYGAGLPELGPEQREATLRALEALEGGRRWCVRILTLSLEAYLGDPIHGGNPDGAAWRYLGAREPVPRPVARARSGAP